MRESGDGNGREGGRDFLFRPGVWVFGRAEPLLAASAVLGEGREVGWVGTHASFRWKRNETCGCEQKPRARGGRRPSLSGAAFIRVECAVCAVCPCVLRWRRTRRARWWPGRSPHRRVRVLSGLTLSLTVPEFPVVHGPAGSSPKTASDGDSAVCSLCLVCEECGVGWTFHHATSRP